MMRAPWEVTREMFLSVEEVEKLLRYVRARPGQCTGRQHATARLDELIVEALLFSGLRSSEFCRLTPADTVVGHGEPAFVVHARRGMRTVFVPGRVDELVQDYVADIRPQFLPEDVDPGDLSQPLLFNERRQPYKRTGLYRRVVAILDRAGLGDRASVQLLRHTYGYLAYLRSGGNLLFVQRQLGHAHPMVTIVYARFVEEDYGGLADRIAGETIESEDAFLPAGVRPDQKGGES